MLDGREDVKEVVYQKSLSYVFKIIWTKLTSGHHDESILALRKLDKLLPGNAMKTCSCYQYLFIVEKTPIYYHWLAHTSHNSGGMAYVYQLEEHKL